MRVYVIIVFRMLKDSFHVSNIHVVRTTICAPALLRGAGNGSCALFCCLFVDKFSNHIVSSCTRLFAQNWINRGVC